MLALPSLAQKPRVVLEGRIEQIAGSSTLSEIVLRAQKPKLDTRPILQSGAQVTGYPAYLLGRWGGDLQVAWSAKAPEVPDQSQSRLGNTGSTVFRFDKVGDQVKLRPSAIYFAREREQLTESMLRNLKIQSENIEDTKKEVRETGGFISVPVLYLAGFKSQSLTGNQFQSRVLYNSTRELKPGTVEQDVLIGEWENNAYGAYHEVVSRFTWYGAKKVYAQIMCADYMADRRAIRRTLLQGWITPDWQQAAVNISNRLNKPWTDVAKEIGLE